MKSFRFRVILLEFKIVHLHKIKSVYDKSIYLLQII